MQASPNPFSENVRKIATKTIESSREILTISTPQIKGILLPKLIAFKNDSSKITDPFAKDNLSLKQEIGLNIFFNVINFCFKDPETGKEYGYKSKDGTLINRSTGLFTALAETDLNWDDLDTIAHLDRPTWVQVTQLSKSNPLYLGDNRGQRLAEFAKFLQKKGCNSSYEFLTLTNFDAVKMLELLINSKLFKDPFLKRAQVMVRSLGNVLGRRKTAKIRNIDTLSCMADYRIPQVFYNLGLVQLSDDLKNTLKSEAKIKSGSKEELALRSTVIVIGMQLAKLIKTTESEIDALLWRMSQQMTKSDLLTIPHMIVFTDKY